MVNTEDIANELVGIWLMYICEDVESNSKLGVSLQIKFIQKVKELKELNPNYKIEVLSRKFTVDEFKEEFKKLTELGSSYTIRGSSETFTVVDLKKTFKR